MMISLDFRDNLRVKRRLTTNREQPKSIFHLLRLKNEKKAAKPVFNALSNGTT